MGSTVSQHLAGGDEMVEFGLPGQHELVEVLLGELAHHPIAIGSDRGEAVADLSPGSSRCRRELNHDFSDDDAWDHLDDLDEVIFGFVTGDDPDCLLRTGGGHEDTIEFGQSGLGCHEPRVPAVDPLRFPHGTQQREDLVGAGVQVLGVASCHAVRFDDVHGSTSWFRSDCLRSAEDTPIDCTALFCCVYASSRCWWAS